jgi:hypothetical protein
MHGLGYFLICSYHGLYQEFGAFRGNGPWLEKTFLFLPCALSQHELAIIFDEAVLRGDFVVQRGEFMIRLQTCMDIGSQPK